MSKAIASALLAILIISGCTQLIQQGAGEINMCMQRCQALCSLAKNSSMNMSGFDQISLMKQSGGVSVSCSCPCPS